MSEQASTKHLERLHIEMMGSLTASSAGLEKAYADLLSLAYAMWGDLAAAERRIWELEQKEQEEEKTECPLCHGEGTNVHFVERANVAINTRCGQCGGKGYLEGEELGHKPPE